MRRFGLSVVLLATLSTIDVAAATAQTFRSGETETTNLLGFGQAVSVGEGEVFVGEPGKLMNPGAVYVYRRGAGGWGQAEMLTASDGSIGDGFGQAIAHDGQTLIISAGGAADGAGQTYLFEKRGGSWEEVAVLRASAAQAGERFGAAVAVEGDLALVGAPNADGRFGRVYAFRRSGGSWVELENLTGLGVSAQSQFGTAIAISGGRALVGAPGQNENNGVVHSFEFNSATGAWDAGDTIEVQTPAGSDRLGQVIGLEGNQALVGAPLHLAGLGAVFVFDHDPNTGEWVRGGQLLPFSGGIRSGFGGAAALTGGEILVGAPGGFRGAAASTYVYRYDTGSSDWSDAVRLMNGDLGAASGFGSTVDAAGNVAAIGATSTGYGSGTVVILERTGDGWATAGVVMSEPEGFESVSGGQVNCNNGQAESWNCSDVDMVSFLSVNDMEAGRGVRVNDVWGWTDSETGREYALVGMTDQAAFVDISDSGNPVYVGRLPMPETARGSSWRDIKVYDNHAFIVSDGAGDHGMQVFDLGRLRDFNGMPTTFDADAHYTQIASAHNIVINEETGFAYSVGGSSGGETCGGGLHMIDIRDPVNPTFAGCFSDPQTGRASTGYSHDAQCFVYHGPDEDYADREICMGANETALSIADVTDKDNPVAVSRAAYPNVGYSHQGWITDDHRYFYLNDELDELQGGASRTRTMIWDITDLDDPQLVKEHLGTQESSDHNLYVRGNFMYQSNYVSGLRILDISDPANPVEVGYFDTVPYGDNSPGFNGSWSNYPFFESGVIIVTSGREGLFMLKKRGPIS